LPDGRKPFSNFNLVNGTTVTGRLSVIRCERLCICRTIHSVGKAPNIESIGFSDRGGMTKITDSISHCGWKAALRKKIGSVKTVHVSPIVSEYKNSWSLRRSAKFRPIDHYWSNDLILISNLLQCRFEKREVFAVR